VNDDDRAERERVYARIAGIILHFEREHPSGTFNVEELREYVTALVPDIAPDSPGRILRLLHSNAGSTTWSSRARFRFISSAT